MAHLQQNHNQQRHEQPPQAESKSLPWGKFIKASLLSQIEPKRCHGLLRFSLLILLVLSTARSLFTLQSAASSSSSLLQLPPGGTIAVVAEKRSKAGSEPLQLQTYIPSAENHQLLQLHDKGSSSNKSVSCSDLIDGRSSSSSEEEGVLCCDRSHRRSDVCYLKGDIRTDAHSSSILLSGTGGTNTSKVEKIQPYTRKWEAAVMSTVDEITLRRTPPMKQNCSVRHGVPAIVFSTGGYTGNLYHEFSDGLIPLYITAERFKGEVVLVVLEYHSWWGNKYGRFLKLISNYKIVHFSKNSQVHCFPEMIVGLKIHGELTIDTKLMHQGKGIQDFQSLLGQGFSSQREEEQDSRVQLRRPKLTIFIRSHSRVLQNLREIVRMCERAGFDVQIINPRRTTPLAEIYSVLNSSHVMLAVHGAAMTHLLFMRPGSVLVQIVPLGLDWAAEAYYGGPARELGLHYIAYKVAPVESSLYRQYDHRNPVIRNPSAITSKGWLETKKVYLDRQNVRLNLRKLGRLITKVYAQIVHTV